MTIAYRESEMSIDECIDIIVAKMGQKGRIILLQMRRQHNKAIYRENGNHASCSAAKAAKQNEEGIRALAKALQDK